ncbi:MAG TPA: LysR family transcriptional regulator [Kiloniellaceae bacterium]|nr:LysR family transcriptional regulator [Kiloniellaceae bacterium]
MDWDKLRIFHSVAEAGSFTHAGDQLNLSQSAVSRQISALEESLKVSLFHRHARGLILTEQGELLYRTAHEVFGKLSMVEALLTESKDRPKGPLRITTMVSFGATWLAPRLEEFMEAYPDIELALLLEDRELDLSMREADVAIRFKPPRQADLIQRLLMTVHIHAYASEDYVERYGAPKTVEDLDEHRIITYGDLGRAPVPEADWLLRIGREEQSGRIPALSINNVYGIRNAILAGAGIGALPNVMANENASLVRVLPDVAGPEFDAYFVYAEEMRASKRIAVFRDFLLRKIAQSAF